MCKWHSIFVDSLPYLIFCCSKTIPRSGCPLLCCTPYSLLVSLVAAKC